MGISGSLPEVGELSSTADPKVRTLLSELKAAVNELEGVQRLKWYEPKIIETEETRTNTAFGTMTTADQIANVVVPANGLLAVGYFAKFKSSVSGAASAAIFVGTEQVRWAGGGSHEENSVSTELTALYTSGAGLSAEGPSGQFLEEKPYLLGGRPGGKEPRGGIAYITMKAGTYTLSIQFKASSGSVSVKNRKLWVGVLGV
jgi:hypothetical protein